MELLRQHLGLSTVVPAASQTLGLACLNPIPHSSAMQRLGTAVTGDGRGKKQGEANLWWVSGEMIAVEHPEGRLVSLRCVALFS